MSPRDTQPTTGEIPVSLIGLLEQLGAELTSPNSADEYQAYSCEISGPFSFNRFAEVREVLRPYFTEVGDWSKRNEDGRMRHIYLIRRL